MNTDTDIKRKRGFWENGRLIFILWRRKYIPATVSLFIVGAIVGILAGVGAWFLKWSIGGLTHFFLSLTKASGPNWFLFGLPFVGIILVGCYQRYWLKRSLEHGVAQVSHALLVHHYWLPKGLCYQPILANVVTLGLGGSAGAEGPIAFAGAAIGSLVARLTGMNPDQIRTLIGCGAGAGIAGIFKSPIGGALFTLEVLKMRLNAFAILTLFVSALFGGITTYILTGFTFNIDVKHLVDFEPGLLGWVALLGVFCGFYSMFYNKVTNIMLRCFNKMKNQWLKYLSSATIVGAGLLMFPILFGEGYLGVNELLNGNTDHFLKGGLFSGYEGNLMMMLLFAFVLIVVKVFVTVSSNSGGGVAGDFAPTIFAGAFAGLVFAWGVNLIFDAQLSPMMFAFLGTAGAFSGIIHAPLMAIFLVAEMPGDGFVYILPLAVTSLTSFITSKIFSIFDRDKWENRSISAKEPLPKP